MWISPRDLHAQLEGESDAECRRLGTADSHFSFGNGLEGLTIENSGVASTGQNGNHSREDCYNCWIKNVRSITGPREPY